MGSMRFYPKRNSLQAILSRIVAQGLSNTWLKDEAAGDFLLPVRSEYLDFAEFRALVRQKPGALDFVYLVDRLQDEGRLLPLDQKMAFRLWDCDFVK